MTLNIFYEYRHFYQFMGVGALVLIGISLMVFGLISFLTLTGVVHW